MARTPKFRHPLRHLRFERIRHWGDLLAFIAERATTLAATGAAKTFTCAVQASTGTLTFGANASADETVTIGDTVYTFKAVIEAVAASGVLTATVTPVDGDTVTIGSNTYRFKAVLAQANDVLVEVLASDALDNLIAAIVGGAGSGTKYHAGTVASTQVTAAAGAGDTVDVTALTAGTAGNAIATTETSSNLSFGAATLVNGKNVEAAYAVEIGATASDSLDNLIAAINAAAGAGTTYGTGTVVHPDVTAAAGAGDTVDVTANAAGAAGDDIATDTDVGSASWGGTTLTGGVTSKNLEAMAHGYSTGQGPFVVSSSGTLPSGLYASTLYWVLKVDADNFQVCTSPECSVQSAVLSDGTGTHTITKAASQAALFGSLRKHPAVVVAAATDVDTL